MAEIEVTFPRDISPSFFCDFISGAEENECHISSFSRTKLRHKFELLIRNKHISKIVKTYLLQENELEKKLPEIAIKSVLNLSLDLKSEVSENFTENLRKISNKYGYVNEEFVVEIDKWLEHRQNLISHLLETVHILRWIKYTTSALALISSAMDLARGIGTLLHTVLTVDLHPKYSPILSLVVGGASVGGSVLALSYFKHTAENIFRGLREEKRLLKHLEIVQRKGNTIDADVNDLFPHGIDLELAKQIALDIDENITDDTPWKQNISFAIILHNFRKNKKLINDKKFLASVKLFVESPAAKIWLYRIKLRKLLDDMVTSLEDILDKKIFSSNEILNQAAINLYPIFFPLFCDTRNLEMLQYICSSLAAISAIVNLSQNDEGKFEGIKNTSEILLKDFKNLKNFSQNFLYEYD